MSQSIPSVTIPPGQILGKGQISAPQANILVKCPAPGQFSEV